MNKQINITYESLINILNNSGLPVGIAYFLMKDLTNQLYEEYQKSLSYEKEIQKSEDINLIDNLNEGEQK